jgi:hypothetical protein
VWHRDSIDLMYDWLKNAWTCVERRLEKVVFPSYNLQELLWGAHASKDVFARLETAFA